MKTSLLIHPEELNKKWIDRMAELRVDTLTLHPRGGKDAGKTLEEMLGWLKTPEYRALLDYAISRGLRISYEMHAATHMLPRELFEKEPLYFRVDENGSRTPQYNFCVTNPSALQMVCDNSIKLAQQLYASNPEFYFWMDDSKNIHCHCDECGALSPSDQQLLIMNAIVRALREEIPTAKVAYLAYFDCMEPPTKVKPEEGVFLEFAPIHRKYNGQVWEEVDIDRVKQLLAVFGCKDAKVLEYWYDNSLLSKWQKPVKQFVPNNDLIRKDIEYYHNLGFESISSFACFLGTDYEELYGEPDITGFSRAIDICG